MSVADEIFAALRGELPEQSFATRFGNQLAQQQFVPRTSSEALWAPALQGLAAGIAQGFGKEQDRSNLFDYYKSNPLIQALASSAPAASSIGPVADGAEYARLLSEAPLAAYQAPSVPPAWKPEQGERDMLTAMLGARQQQEAEAAVAKQLAEDRKFQADLVKGIATKFGAIYDPATGSATPIAGIGGSAVDKIYGEFSADEKARYANAPSIINEVFRIADKAKALNQSALTLNLAKQYAGSGVNEVISEAKQLVTNLRRLQGDTGNSAFGEQAMALEAILGDRTAGSETLAKRLRGAGEALQRIVSGSFEARVAGETEGIEGVRRAIRGEAAKPKTAPPRAIAGESFEEYKARIGAL